MASAIVKKKLVRKYGFFKCTKCKNVWQSAHVYCDPKTLQAKYKQSCKVCKTYNDPYKTEDIKCSQCGLVKVECKCKRSLPDDPERAHRRDLCQKCLSGDPCTTSRYPTAGDYSPDDDRYSDVDYRDLYNDFNDDFDDDPYNFDDLAASLAEENDYDEHEHNRYDEDEYNHYDEDEHNHYDEDYNNYYDYENDDDD